MVKPLYGIDFGGSTIRIGKVNRETGELVGEPFVRLLKDVSTNEKLNEIIFDKIPKGVDIGICAAGTIDEKNLIIKQSPNSKIKGQINFGKCLAENGHNVIETGDMRAAVQAAAKFGEGKDYNNVLVATYSSGYNCAVTRDFENVTDAEFGHLPYGNDLFCGCGKKGHLESYVSGNGAAIMAKQFFDATNITDHPILKKSIEDLENEELLKEGICEIKDLRRDPKRLEEVIKKINAKHVYQAFKENPEQEPQKSIRETQVKAIADSFTMMNSVYNPLDIMVLMGSQTKDWYELFEPAKIIYYAGESQMDSLDKPIIVKTELSEIGIQGAAAYFLKEMSN